MHACCHEFSCCPPLSVAFGCRCEEGRDAAGLADLLLMGRLREAWIAPREKRKLTCEITLVNTAIVSLRTGLDSWNLATDQKAGSSNPSECATAATA